MNVLSEFECPYCGTEIEKVVTYVGEGLHLRAPMLLVTCPDFRDLDNDIDEPHGCGGTFVVEPQILLREEHRTIGLEGETERRAGREAHALALQGEFATYYVRKLQQRIAEGGRALSEAGRALGPPSDDQ